MADPEFLIDSNIAIHVLKNGGCRPALQIGSMAPGTVVTSAISFAEVMRGIPETEISALENAKRLFRIVPVQPFDAAAALAYGRLPFRRARFDRLIAAHALSLGLTLVTNNEGDFADVPGLKVENWT